MGWVVEGRYARGVGRSSQKKNWVQGWRDTKNKKGNMGGKIVRARKKRSMRKKTTDQIN
jgi:hypothetical protein